MRGGKSGGGVGGGGASLIMALMVTERSSANEGEMGIPTKIKGERGGEIEGERKRGMVCSIL